MSTVKIDIDLNKRCAECSKKGAAQNGLCIACTTKALDPEWRPRSQVARNVQTYIDLKRIEEIHDERIAQLDARQMANIKARQKERKMARGKKGHNVEAVADPARLKSFLARIEKVEEDQAALSDDKKAIYAEAKATGLDTTVLRALVSRRKKDPEKLREFEEMLDIYRAAVGDLIDTPLGKAGEPKGAHHAS